MTAMAGRTDVREEIPRIMSGDGVLTRKAFRVLLGLLVAAFAGGIILGFPTAVTFATAIGFAAAIAGMKKPGLGLLGIGILCTLDPASRVFVFGKGVLPWNTFNYFLVVVILVNAGPVLRLNDISSLLLKFFLAVLVLWLLLAPAGSFESGFGQIMNVATTFGLLVYFMKGLRSKETLYFVGLLCGVVGVLAGLLYNLHLGRLEEMNYNAWAYVPLTAMFGLALAMRTAPTTGSGQIWMALLAVVNLLWAFLSTSRGGLLVGTVCMIFILLSMKRSSHRLGVVGGALLIGGLGLAQFSDMNVQSISRLNKFFDSDEPMSARTSGRSDLMIGAWNIFLDNPMGIGTGGFPYAWKGLGYMEDMSGFAYGQRKASHSAWLSTLAENGVLGALLLAGYVVSFALMGWWGRQRGLLPLGVFATVIIAMAFVSTEFMAKGLWFFAAGTTALCIHPGIPASGRDREKDGPLDSRSTSLAARQRPSGVLDHQQFPLNL